MISPTAEQLRLTPTEKLLFQALADGKPHRPDELLKIIDEDGLSDRAALANHIKNMRAKLNIVGEEVVCQSFGNHTGYRRVRLLHVNTNE
jgi:hypothetical protein